MQLGHDGIHCPLSLSLSLSLSLPNLTRGVSQFSLAIYIKKHLKAKEESWKLKYFTMQKYNLQKSPLKETKIVQDIIIITLL